MEPVVYIFLGFSVLISGCLSQTTAPVTCTTSYPNSDVTTYKQGDVWVDENACDVCVCNQYGTQCHAGLEGDFCPLNGTAAKAGDAACKYTSHVYLFGDVFATLDGCNTCLCTERGMQCTGLACEQTGFAVASVEPIYGDCQYNDGWYKYGAQWQADDGCNTCYCYGVGNVRGPHVCTTSTCTC